MSKLEVNTDSLVVAELHRAKDFSTSYAARKRAGCPYGAGRERVRKVDPN